MTSGDERGALEVLRNAIKMELEGKVFFENAAKRMKNDRARDMFLVLVKQEERHVEVIGEQLRRLEADMGWASFEEIPSGTGTLPEVSVFKDADLNRTKLRHDAGELEVLKLGMDVEKKSMEYYTAARESIDDARAKEMFTWLIEEENGHLTILRAEYDNRAQSGFYFNSAEFSLEVE